MMQTQLTQHFQPQITMFREGMTLDQYLSSIPTLSKQYINDEEEKVEEDLYQTSRKVQPKFSQKIITYEIRECDEDNYEESIEEGEEKKYSANYEHRHGREIPVNSFKNINQNTKRDENKNKIDFKQEFRIRRQSNSPSLTKKKQIVTLSPGKILSQTHYLNHDWRIHKQSNYKRGNTFSTIYGKFLNGVKHVTLQNPPILTEQNSKMTGDKEKYFKTKNIKEMERIAKYERNITQKYSKYRLPDILNMRIQGIPDKLCERKFHSNKKIK